MVEFPKKAGPYRMHCESGNSYFVVVELGPYKTREMSIHVFQPLRFRGENIMSDSQEDIIREFGPTSFTPLVLFNLDGTFAEDIQAPRPMEALQPVTA
jgi:hypothetical protein